ncbi:MAG: hypothetical protein V3V50_07145 [Gammaproteobacteria bacterium]
MKLCSACCTKRWPYAMAVFIAAFTAFLTWLTLSSSGIQPVANSFLSTIAFILVGGALLMYMLNCMRRHCKEDEHHL